MYDGGHISRFFDDYGEREWERLESDAAQRASFHQHRRLLERYVRDGDRVLEAGAGPGRFTIELAKIGARVVALDISRVQLALHAEKTSSVAVEGRIVADICDLGAFADDSFDAAVAFGGPLSYVLDRRDDALEELLRVVKPGGPVLLSVMSLLTAFRIHLAHVLSIAREHGLGPLRDVQRTGDDATPATAASGHRSHLYRSAELKAMLEAHGCEILAATAANYVTVQNEERLQAVEPELWQYVLELEADLTGEPGALDAGTHILVAVRRT